MKYMSKVLLAFRMNWIKAVIVFVGYICHERCLCVSQFHKLAAVLMTVYDRFLWSFQIVYFKRTIVH